MTPAHDSRPRPQYGEYADPATISEATAAPISQPADEALATDLSGSQAISAEHSTRDQAAQEVVGGEDQRAPGAGTTQSATDATTNSDTSAQPYPQQYARATGPLPGVPHNLGAKGGTTQASPAASGASANHTVANAPYGPTADSVKSSANQAVNPAALGTATGAAPGIANSAAQTRQRGADRIVTIVLLAIGSYFALSMALTLSRFSLEFSKVADELGVTDFVAPPMLKTLGTVGAILVLAIYALVLIFSIRRLRARKLTFWAPLVAGAIAWVLFFVLFLIGLQQSADLWQALLNLSADPAAAQQLLERLNAKN